jgi:hypothetical protein
MKFEREVEILKGFRLYKTNLTLVQLARHTWKSNIGKPQ